MEENFGGGIGGPKSVVSWWPLIEDISVSGSEATIKTSIYPDDEGRRIATNIRGAVLGYMNANSTPDPELRSVIVRGQNNTILATGRALQ